MTESKSVAIHSETLTTALVVDLFKTGETNRKFNVIANDPQEIARRIAQRDVNATSLDELLGGGGDIISGKNYVNKPFQIESVEWQPSDIDGEGLPFYAVLHIVTIDGEIKVMTCGAQSVVRKVAVMAHNGWLPAWVKITKGTKTEAGYEPLDLVKAAGPEEKF